MKSLHLIIQLLRLGYHVKYHANQDFTFIKHLSDNTLKPFGHKLDPNYFSPIRHYLIGLRITNLWFSTLRGYPCKEHEIMAGRYLGAMTPLFDSLFDDKRLTMNDIRDAISSQNPDNLIITLLRTFRTHLLENVKNRENVEEKLELVIQSQMQSLEQKNPDISIDQVRRITFDKGGFALLLCRSILDHPMKENEEEMILHLGALVQLTNDIFDVLEDHRKSIKTMADGISDFDSLTSEHQGLIISFLRESERCDYKKSNLWKFQALVMLILSRGLVCIDHLKKSQKENNGVFHPGSMSRKQLICDMEKPSNFLKSLKYSLTYLRNYSAYN